MPKFPSSIDLEVRAAPPSPPDSGYVRVYANPDLSIHAMDANGDEGGSVFATRAIVVGFLDPNGLTAGLVEDIVVPDGGTIKEWTILADQSGDCEISVWSDTYGNYPPTGADDITGANPPSMTGAEKAHDATLSGWNTAVTAGTTFRFTLASVASLTRVRLMLFYEGTGGGPKGDKGDTGATGALNPGTLPEIASPGSPPSAGNAFLYAKSDGRIYSMDPGGVEYGPFDVGGAGFEIDETFPGSSLPAGWAFTGSGSCTVSGNKAHVVGGAQGDRLMFAYTPTNAGQLTTVRAHLKNISGTGGMPSLVALDSAGKGWGVGPYNDGTFYNWVVQGTAYHYSATGNGHGANPALTDLWLSIDIMGGYVVGTGYSTDGIAWTCRPVNLVYANTISQLGICQLWTVANIDVELWELTTTAA